MADAPTPHISAKPGDIAPLVLMPGDPRRARRIAERFMTDARLVTELRGIEGWTGLINGVPMTVHASGMGVPSMMIYATELFRSYGVQRIARIGTAASLGGRLNTGDVVIASGAHTNSSIAALTGSGTLALVPAWDMLAGAAAARSDPRVRVGTVVTSDHFYDGPVGQLDHFASFGALAVEMEAAGLYYVAAREQRQALAIMTISDHIGSTEAMSAEERETTFDRMVTIAIAALNAPTTPALPRI